MRAKYLLLALLTAPALAPMFAQDAGISRALATSRAARVSDIRYNLTFELNATAPAAPAIPGTEVLTFTYTGPLASPANDLPLDYRDGTLQFATLNGHDIPQTLTNGHLTLPATALLDGPNTLKLVFSSLSAPAGKAITRYKDKDDGSEYLYTLFVPADADMAFPCFDQPDLKARFTLTIAAPPAWTVIANTGAGHASRQGQFDTITFPETLPISTYLFAFAAGPFAAIPGKPGEPTLFVRKSQLAKAQPEAPEVQAITRQGIAYLSDYFQQPFPFPKYDLVLIPGFPFGGMEHAGATFLNEDGVLFRSTPTASDYFRRDVLILHETTHQWFGDLVTMRWFDDLWLKEGFAQYMAYKAMAKLKPETQPWKHFNEDIKPLAYAIDETQGTTPIFQNIPNLKDAKSAYGAIVYQKAPAILKQLDYKLGDYPFRNGLRLYLKQHAYANATWPDLVQAFTRVSGKDLKPWADAWITHRGMPEIDTELTCGAGRVVSLKLKQHDVLGTSMTWPISNEVVAVTGYSHCATDAGCLRATSSRVRWRVDWSDGVVEVPEARGTECPDYVFANDQDQAYGRFLLDSASEKAVVRILAPSDQSTVAQSPATPAEGMNPLMKTQLWTALWENVRTAHSAPRTYVDLVLQTLPTETDESLNRIQGGRAAQSLHFYLGPKGREALLPRAEKLFADRMLNAPTLGLRITNFRTFTSVAQTPAALAQVKQLLAGTLTVPGLTLKPLDRWNLIGHLIQQGDSEAKELFATELNRDHNGEAQKYAYAAMAGTPTPTIKAQYFDDYQGTKVQEDWLTQSLRPFNSYNQQALTLPYLKQALDQLPQIKANRKIFFLGAWLGAFLDGQSTPEAQQIVHAWLAQPNIDPDLRLKVLEQSDNLDRTVLIRKTFPD